MSWRERLRPASFRGAPFFVEQIEGQVGRRVVVHEYPDRDVPDVEDLGGVSGEFKIDAYVLGDDYMDARDALIAALNKRGSGRLVHPWIGELVVTVKGPVAVRESTAEGGMAHFTITVIEGSEPRVVTAEPDTQALVEEQADIALEAIAGSFEEGFSLVGALEDARDLARSSIADATSKLRQVKGAVTAVVSSVESITAAIDSFEGALNDLLNLPASLASAFAGLVASVTGFGLNIGGGDADDSTQNGRNAMDGFRSLSDFTPTGAPTSPATPQQTIKADNQRAIQRLVQQTAAVEATRAVAQSEFTTVDDAVAVAAELEEKLDTLSTDGVSDEVYIAFTDLRAALRRHMESSAINLPRLARFTPPMTLPALVIAQRLYQDPTREQEIVDRNSIVHPGFVPGGVELRVLDE